MTVKKADVVHAQIQHSPGHGGAPLISFISEMLCVFGQLFSLCLLWNSWPTMRMITVLFCPLPLFILTLWQNSTVSDSFAVARTWLIFDEAKYEICQEHLLFEISWRRMNLKVFARRRDGLPMVDIPCFYSQDGSLGIRRNSMSNWGHFHCLLHFGDILNGRIGCREVISPSIWQE